MRSNAVQTATALKPSSRFWVLRWDRPCNIIRSTYRSSGWKPTWNSVNMRIIYGNISIIFPIVEIISGFVVVQETKTMKQLWPPMWMQLWADHNTAPPIWINLLMTTLYDAWWNAQRILDVICRQLSCVRYLNQSLPPTTFIAFVHLQFLGEIDYGLAFKTFSDRTTFKTITDKSIVYVDAMDSYYNCIWDVTLLEFIINFSAKRGEHTRKQLAVSTIISTYSLRRSLVHNSHSIVASATFKPNLLCLAKLCSRALQNVF